MRSAVEEEKRKEKVSGSQWIPASGSEMWVEKGSVFYEQCIVANWTPLELLIFLYTGG